MTEGPLGFFLNSKFAIIAAFAGLLIVNTLWLTQVIQSGRGWELFVSKAVMEIPETTASWLSHRPKQNGTLAVELAHCKRSVKLEAWQLVLTALLLTALFVDFCERRRLLVLLDSAKAPVMMHASSVVVTRSITLLKNIYFFPARDCVLRTFRYCVFFSVSGGVFQGVFVFFLGGVRPT